MLAVDAVEQAQSWTRFLRYNPRNPEWPNRDRLVLSAGHGSMLLYAMLHLTGYDLPLEEIKRFRQWSSRTPGHPEYRHTPGVETTTVPLGQGFGAAVGMAIGERLLAKRFNRPDHPLIDYRIYVIGSDGDLMEGVSSEAASLAGHLRLGNLIYIYLDNEISIEGSTSLAFSEDVRRRFDAYGWHTIYLKDGHDLSSVEEALAEASAESSRPSLIIARTIIGYGSPQKAGTAEAHGAPLGAEEARRTKENLGWPYEEPFTIPPEVLEFFRRQGDRGRRLEEEWKGLLSAYEDAHPELAAAWQEAVSGLPPSGWRDHLPDLSGETSPMATRSASGRTLNALAKVLPGLVGGSADLAPSTETYLKEYGSFSAHHVDRNLHFGVREHVMGTALNGLALTPGLIPYGGTFLIFSDYMRPAIRIAAQMGVHVIYVFTHDSIGLGEDGPTHQPVEHLASLRAMPGLTVIRPADATETVAAWRVALERSGPVALALTRQKIPVLDRKVLPSAELLERGAYILSQADGASSSGAGVPILAGSERPLPDLILIATGSEVSLALKAQETLAQQGLEVRVVSMPSWELFEEQPEEYRNHVLPPEVRARLAIEAASPLGWERYIGSEGAVIGVNRFGASAPYQTVMENYGFTVENVVRRALSLAGVRQE